MQSDPVFHASSALEKVLEHRFVAELSAALWQRGIIDFEVLRSEVDRHGYDLVVEAHGVLRHIQLKAMRRGGKRAKVTINTRLSAKLSGCVVWMIYDPASLALGPFLWFGGDPGERLPCLGEKIALHAKGNAQGVKTPRADHRVLSRSAFEPIATMEALAMRLFGASLQTEAARAGDSWLGPLQDRGRSGRGQHPAQPAG